MAHVFRVFGNHLGRGEWLVDSEEAHHLQKVLRLKVSNPVEIFDGEGLEGFGQIVALGAKEARVQTPTLNQCLKPIPVRVAVGITQKKTTEDLVARLGELPISQVDFFRTAGVAKHRFSSQLEERLRRILIASAKQSKQGYLAQIRYFDSPGELVESFQLDEHRRFVFDASGKPFLGELLEGAPPTGVRLVLGGEQGLTADEVNLFSQHGCAVVGLGDTVLTSFTASLVATSFACVRFARLKRKLVPPDNAKGDSSN